MGRLWVKPWQPKTLPEYMQTYFPPIQPGDNLITGEASPAYLSCPAAPTNMRAMFPNAHIIASVREPVDRVYSRISHLVRLRCENDKGQTFCQPGGDKAAFEFAVEQMHPYLHKYVPYPGLVFFC